MKQIRIILLLLIFALAATGCSTEPPITPQPNANQQEEKSSYPLSIVDDTGTTVILKSKPERIVSLLPSSTEIMTALGYYPVAVTKWDNYPADVQEKAEFVFQDSLNPNLEQFIKLEPDLIFFYQTTPQNITKIRNLGIPVVIFDSQSISQTYEAISKTGQILDRQQEASQLINQMKEKEQALRDKISQLSPDEKRKVWLEVDNQLYTAGRDTFLNEIITKAGGINIAEDVQGWGQFNNEQILSRNPDIILVTYGSWDANAVKNIKERKGWQNINAVKNNRIMELDNDIISRPGPRIIEGLELTAKAIYPELF